MMIGIDTNVFIKLFDSAESLNHIKKEGDKIFTYPKCLWEMVKYVKTLQLKDRYSEGVVMDFMKRNSIFLTQNIDEDSEKEVKAFEEKCRKAGIDCHSPDSEIILAFKKEGVKMVYSMDINFRKAAERIGMKAGRFNSLDDDRVGFERG